MSSRRISKVNEAVRECVAMEILCKVRDPRVKNVTVLRADTAADMRTAKVYVSVMGDEKVQALTMHGLRAAKGYLQSQLADRLQTRYTPVLTFVLDPSVKKSVEASRLIHDALHGNSLHGEGESGVTADEAERADEDWDEEATEAEATEVGIAGNDAGQAGDNPPENAGLSSNPAISPEATQANAPGDREGAGGSAQNTG